MPTFDDLPDLPTGNDDETVRKRIRMRTIARFEACEAARREALDAGKTGQEAHNAAKAIWNGWAEAMLADKKKLQDAGQWETERGVTVFGRPGIAGANEGTRTWFEEAASDFSSVLLRPSIGEDQEDRRKDNDTPLSETDLVKTLLCASSRIDFSQFRFPGDAWFHRATFEGDARFSSATFEGDAWFHSARFEDDAWFHSARFEDDAWFYSARFKGGAWFHRARFKGVAAFHRARFKGDAWFDSARFKAGAQFGRARFKGDAWFDSAMFEGNAEFHLVEFFRNADFGKAQFEKAADFKTIEVKRAFDMADAAFKTSVPDFIQAHFVENPRLDNVTPPKLGFWKSGGSLHRDDPARYRALMRMAEQAKDHDREHVFFKGQMRAERKLGNGTWFGRMLNRVYDALSDYGRSFVRPLVVLAVVWFVFAGVYGGFASPATCGQILNPVASAATRLAWLPDWFPDWLPDRLPDWRPDWRPDWHPAGGYLLSMTNSLPAVSAGQRHSIINAQVELFGATTCVPKAVAYLGVLQTLLSVVLLFLAALGLRNMFRIK